MVTGSRILILDCGSQFTQLIASRVREARVYSEIHPADKSIEWIREWKPDGIILSGGPNSVTDDDAPTVPKQLLDEAPVLGVCYGMQLIAHMEGGEVVGAEIGARGIDFDLFELEHVDAFDREILGEAEGCEQRVDRQEGLGRAHRRRRAGHRVQSRNGSLRARPVVAGLRRAGPAG